MGPRGVLDEDEPVLHVEPLGRFVLRVDDDAHAPDEPSCRGHSPQGVAEEALAESTASGGLVYGEAAQEGHGHVVPGDVPAEGLP